jgi:hypothetical protein
VHEPSHVFSLVFEIARLNKESAMNTCGFLVMSAQFFPILYKNAHGPVGDIPHCLRWVRITTVALILTLNYDCTDLNP